ncbi:hypothetical protein Y032_0656g1222 [Ancylostoma ceylanicum]|uniref:Uncharacterized protein n=1 Tax=Ancylostoma ceylanicum TaxID=53326 RepID=A0A016WJJ4_9BILA|nr:hypothetical protein Y032_0656g1222 [Ancylostoma ceylanicum]
MLLLPPQHPRCAGEATPNIHIARRRRVDVAAAGVEIVIDVPCTHIHILPIRNDESAHAVGDPEAPTLASNPLHHF